jgi:hypothetical protein
MVVVMMMITSSSVGNGNFVAIARVSYVVATITYQETLFSVLPHIVKHHNLTFQVKAVGHGLLPPFQSSISLP